MINELTQDELITIRKLVMSDRELKEIELTDEFHTEIIWKLTNMIGD